MYRTGKTQGFVTSSDLPDRLWSEIDEVTLDTINYVLPHLTMIVETVAARDPELAVEPFAGGQDAELSAKVGAAVARYYWLRQRVTDRVLQDATQDFVVLGNGFCKVGWAHAEEEVDRDPGEVEAELAEAIEADLRFAQLERREPTDPDELADRVVLTERVAVEDEPYVEYVSPYDILVPVNARRMEESPWVAQRVVMPADEARANPQFDSGALDELSTMYGDRDGPWRSDDDEAVPGRSFGGDDDPFEQAEVFEFYDLRTRRLQVFQANAERPLYDDEMPYSHRYPPFVHLRNFNDGGSRFWSFGDLENIAPLQHQLNEYVYEQMDNARRAGNKYMVDAAVYTDRVRELLESDQPDVVVPVELAGRPMGEVVQPVQRHGLPEDVYAAKHDLQESMREVLGLNDFQTGGVGADRMSATAAAVVDGTATLRASGKRQQVEGAAAQIGLQILLLCQEFMDESRLVRVAGPDGAVWLDVSVDDIRGEFDVKVEVGSTQAINPATRQQRAVELIQQVIPALEASGFDSSKLWRHAIRDLGYDPDVVLRHDQAGEPQPGGGAQMAEPGVTVPQEAMGGPPVPAAVNGDIAL